MWVGLFFRLIWSRLIDNDAIFYFELYTDDVICFLYGYILTTTCTSSTLYIQMYIYMNTFIIEFHQFIFIHSNSDWILTVIFVSKSMFTFPRCYCHKRLLSKLIPINTFNEQVYRFTQVYGQKKKQLTDKIT
jgi:hypothetical protein